MKHNCDSRNAKYSFLASCLTAAILILIVIFSFGCGCNYHLKKAAKKCGTTSIKDTLTIHDTITIEKVKHDTTFNYNYTLDTVYLTKDRLKIKYFRHDSLIYLSGECAADTVVRILRVPYEKQVLNFNWWRWFKGNLIGILIILFFFFGIFALWRMYVK